MSSMAVRSDRRGRHRLIAALSEVFTLLPNDCLWRCFLALTILNYLRDIEKGNRSTAGRRISFTATYEYQGALFRSVGQLRFIASRPRRYARDNQVVDLGRRESFCVCNWAIWILLVARRLELR